MADMGISPAPGGHHDAINQPIWLRRPLHAYKWLVIVLAAALVSAVTLIPAGMVFPDYVAAVRTLVGSAVTLVRTHAAPALMLAGALVLLLALSVAGEIEYQRRVRVRARPAPMPAPAASDAAPVMAAPEEPGTQQIHPPPMDNRPAALTRMLVAAGRQAAGAVRATPAGVVAPAGLPLPEALVGRESLVAEVIELLREQKAVALVARDHAWGIGTSGLAAEVAARLAPDGVIWIACEGWRGEAGITALWSQVARALGLLWVAEDPNVELRRATVQAALADVSRKAGVLVLDHVEPELDIQAVLDTLGHDNVRLLVTARALPESSPIMALEVGALASDAAQLLLSQQVSRLRGAQGGPDEGSADESSADAGGTLADLLPFLDGWPLAIRLSAPVIVAHEGPWADLVAAFEAAATTDEPAARLRAHLLRAWNVTTGQEQALLAGLSLLDGETFPRAVALAIAGASADGVTEEQAADALDALVGLALLEAREGERLSFHATIRQWAVEHRSSQDAALSERMGLALVAYWLAYAERHPQSAVVEALDKESAGLVSAIAWAHDHARHREVLTLAHALIPFWQASDRLEDAGRALPWALEAARALGDEREIQYMQHEVALCLSLTGHTDEARTAFESALTLARSRADQRDELNELQELAALECGARNWKAAREHFTAAMKIADELGDRREQRRAWHGLAGLEAETGQLIVARDCFEQALELATLLADRRALREDLHGLADVEMRVGHTEQAQRYYSEALDLARGLDDGWMMRESLHGLALLEQRLGHFNRALGHLEEALQLARQVGDLSLQALELQALGSLALDMTEVDRARGYLQEGLRLARQVNQQALIADALRWTALLEERLGNGPAAREGLRAALDIYERLGSPEARVTRQRLVRLGGEARAPGGRTTGPPAEG